MATKSKNSKKAPATKTPVEEVKPVETHVPVFENSNPDLVETEVQEENQEAIEQAGVLLEEKKQTGTSDDQEPITLLIPYLQSEAAGEELKYALRSWEKNFKEQFKVIVIGDREDWFSNEITHIEHFRHQIFDKGRRKEIANPQADVAHKLFTAITTGLVKGKFILSNDDIYVLGDQTLGVIEMLKTFGNLTKLAGKPGGLYRENALRTAKLLQATGKPTVRYGTHTPVVLEAEKLLEVLITYKCVEQGTLVSSLYFNHFYPDARGTIGITGGPECTWLASVYRPDPNKALLESAFKTRYYINCNSAGWEALKPYLEKEFPNKSRFEK